MNYHIKPQGDNWLVIQAEPDNPKDRLAERIIAVCGNRTDALQVANGLYLVDSAVGSPAGGIGEH